MPKTRPPYPAEFRQQMIELVRAGRDPVDLAREFEPSVWAIRNWVAEADRSEGRASSRPAAVTVDASLTAGEREERARLQREDNQLKLERDILYCVTAWFARETGVLPSISSHS